MTKRSRLGHAGLAGLWRRWRVQRATAISAIPIGMPGWPDLAASTASIASARMELASSASLAFVVTRESIGGRKLYSAHDPPPIQPSCRFRALRELRGARRRPLVRVPRRPAAGRDGTARAPIGRSPGARAARMGEIAVAGKRQLARLGCASDDVSRAAERQAVLDRGAAEGSERAGRNVLRRVENALYRARRCAICPRRP